MSRPGIYASLMTAMLLIACVGPGPRDDVQGSEKAARINVQLGAAYLEQGDLELANLKLERALQQDPSLATAHWTYALLQVQLDRPKVAERHFRKAMDLDPKDSRANNAYGVYLCNAGRLQEAQTQFERALDNPLYDRPETVLTNAGVCLLKEGDGEQAEEYFRKALAENGRYGPALYEMAKLSFEKQRYAQARTFLGRHEDAAGHNASTLWLAVQTERALGDRSAAGSYALQLKNRYPDSPEAAQLLQTKRDGS